MLFPLPQDCRVIHETTVFALMVSVLGYGALTPRAGRQGVVLTPGETVHGYVVLPKLFHDVKDLGVDTPGRVLSQVHRLIDRRHTLDVFRGGDDVDIPRVVGHLDEGDALDETCVVSPIAGCRVGPGWDDTRHVQRGHETCTVNPGLNPLFEFRSGPDVIELLTVLRFVGCQGDADKPRGFDDKL